MRYVIAYDVSDDLRRDRIAELLKGYGRRIQESVFLAELESALATEMCERLRVILQPGDKGHVFAFCTACERRVRTFGHAELDADADYYIL